MTDEATTTAKVLFRVVGEDEGDVNVETLWAFDLGQDRYRLDNTPFYAYSVSVGDVVLAPMNGDEQRPTFVSVLEKSGNRTVRVVFDLTAESGNETDKHLTASVAMGCDYEGANRRYIAINIPPGVHLDAVQDSLVTNELNWEHADPSYDELHPDEAWCFRLFLCPSWVERGLRASALRCRIRDVAKDRGSVESRAPSGRPAGRPVPSIAVKAAIAVFSTMSINRGHALLRRHRGSPARPGPQLPRAGGP